MMTLSISPTGRLKRQDRRRDCQRPAFVEAQSLHVSFPQLQRDDAAIGLQPQAPASLRKAESSGSEAQPCLMGREECVRVQLGLREQGRPRAYWSGAQETVFSTSKDNRSEREASLQPTQHLVEGYAVPQLLDESAQDGQLLTCPVCDLRQALPPLSERRRNEPADGKGHEGNDVVRLGDGQRQVGLGEEEIQTHRRHDRFFLSYPATTE